jgi:predicted nucleic acid-binding protein
MPADEREFSASDLASRWLTVDQVLGAGAARAHATPADEHPAPDLVAADTALASRWFTADPVPGKLAGRTVLLPFVAVAELATWPERLLWGHSRTEELSQWTDPGRMILGDDTVSRIWARITVAAQRAGSPPPLNDAWIAAGCLSYGLPLATVNKRSYRYFADRYGLELL